MIEGYYICIQLSPAQLSGPNSPCGASSGDDARQQSCKLKHTNTHQCACVCSNLHLTHLTWSNFICSFEDGSYWWWEDTNEVCRVDMRDSESEEKEQVGEMTLQLWFVNKPLPYYILILTKFTYISCRVSRVFYANFSAQYKRKRTLPRASKKLCRRL